MVDRVTTATASNARERKPVATRFHVLASGTGVDARGGHSMIAIKPASMASPAEAMAQPNHASSAVV
jgi:hypothetical protein